MLPERGRYIPDPVYIRQLIRQLGWTQSATAYYLHMPLKTLERKLAGIQPIRYCEQRVLEAAVKDTRVSTVTDGPRQANNAA